jgi:hypothetical protein
MVVYENECVSTWPSLLQIVILTSVNSCNVDMFYLRIRSSP